jgi:hypothetical protein
LEKRFAQKSWDFSEKREEFLALKVSLSYQLVDSGKKS